MRNFRVPAILAVLVALSPVSAHAQDFEALVEDALERNTPKRQAPQPEAPATAVPPRLGVDPIPAPVFEPEPPAAPVEISPSVAAPETPPAAETPPAETPPLPALAAPKPYTPPTRSRPAESEPAAAEAAQETEAPAAASAATEAASQNDASMALLRMEEVNAATFSPEAVGKRGANPLILKAQILLDRAGASPGVIDGVAGGNVAKAVAAVETVLGLPIDGRLDEKVWAALGGDAAPDVLIDYEITGEDAAYAFLDAIPQDYAVQAELDALNFTSPEEMFGERFHMDVKLLKALNPNVDMRKPGNVIVVADVVGQPVTGKIARIEADKRSRQVRAYDAQDRLVVAYPATIGSSDNPSPSGTHKVNAVAPNPIYYYDPKNFVQGNNTKELELPPGPNNPVGTMWIDLSEPSYGIHGTPEPSKIDKTGSHGCIRLTNWDAEELATLVKPGVDVAFVE